MSGLFVTLEGIDGAGKTSLAWGLQALRERWPTPRPHVVVTHEPGGTLFGLELMRLWRTHAWGTSRETALHLYLADRVHHVERVIAPALADGHLVLCDRYVDSTRAYQGPWLGRGLVDAYGSGPTPDLTLLLDLDIPTAAARVSARGDHASCDCTPTELATVRAAYLDLARDEPRRVVVLDATKPPEVLRDEALTLIRARWESRPVYGPSPVERALVGGR